jgi:transcriptional regulator with XRE-family HTH domain
VNALPRLIWAGMNGVLDMVFLSMIRRWHKRDHVPIREISRRTGVSRNTIRKYLRSELIEPKVRVPDRPSKLDLNVAVSAQGHI